LHRFSSGIYICAIVCVRAIILKQADFGNFML